MIVSPGRSHGPAHPQTWLFTILPAFYQTIWFRSLCVVAFLAFLWGLHQLRVQQLRGEESKLREAIETIPAMAWIAGSDGTVQFRNRRWVVCDDMIPSSYVRATASSESRLSTLICDKKGCDCDYGMRKIHEKIRDG